MDTPDPPRWTRPRSATDLGRFVRRVRRHRGITQEALAADLGITRQYVSELENGAENLYVRRLFEIFDELGIDVRLEERP
ncbi:helix-turn-helix transcriptional regulator [Cellulosimicrobium cellulans]|uniref:helix-turn-helix transcriptional regulator n=1 Tax=Cellulosimicrobium cellulans TaxID=1710 RepID=UPI00084872B6|nr:helix-turn-helix transcriptional regulator [Cellulosimicrobium cellulans]